jgi:hypothetical protein
MDRDCSAQYAYGHGSRLESIPFDPRTFLEAQTGEAATRMLSYFLLLLSGAGA